MLRSSKVTEKREMHSSSKKKKKKKKKWKEKHLKESWHGFDKRLRFLFLQKLLECRQRLK